MRQCAVRIEFRRALDILETVLLAFMTRASPSPATAAALFGFDRDRLLISIDRLLELTPTVVGKPSAVWAEAQRGSCCATFTRNGFRAAASLEASNTIPN